MRTRPAIITARLTAGVSEQFDLADAWRNRVRGRDGWPDEPALARIVVDRFTDVVGRVLQAGAVDTAARRETELSVGTLYGMARVGEVMHEQLDVAGPRWLAPEMFLYYSPHSVVSAAALAHGLGGAATTLLGRQSGVQALTHALRRLATRQADTVIVGAYEALTPFAAAALASLDVPHRTGCGDAAAVLLRQDPDDAGGPPDHHGEHRRVSLARGVADAAELHRVLAAAGVDPAAVTALWPAGTTRAVRQAAGAQFAPALPAARPSVGTTSSPAVEPLRALTDATGVDGAATVVVAGRPGTWDVVVVS